MEFLDKKHRIVVMSIAQGGPAGIDKDDLFQSMNLVMSKETLSHVLEDLYFDGSVNILRDGNEIRYVASKDIRESMIALELQKYKLAEKLEELKELSKNQDKDKAEAILNSVKEVSILISNSILSLLKSSPSLTVPEYLDIVDAINRDFLSKLVPLLEGKPSKRELEILMKLVSRYRGEKDAEKLKLVLDKLYASEEQKKKQQEENAQPKNQGESGQQ
ncbi:hypothetical protein [Sulfuracidifex tepidarius]|uniref:Uncharacterized protein n=1 Tax=Sulfuracidifex tepidarius TaxID=1294262 RepID=A0A510E646_9CREN|nr:hypothetical protein [Sulfuracidifex tepidarius]BBG25219.1 hypothetical protein IC006_2554 [Sulfuracidifex tepidarius]BBG28013.1 hypothetical protein IC007_2568 [Sulfuracidifex tepidarius]